MFGIDTTQYNNRAQPTLGIANAKALIRMEGPRACSSEAFGLLMDFSMLF